jgi:hypothetical protein
MTIHFKFGFALGGTDDTGFAADSTASEKRVRDVGRLERASNDVDANPVGGEGGQWVHASRRVGRRKVWWVCPSLSQGTCIARHFNPNPRRHCAHSPSLPPGPSSLPELSRFIMSSSPAWKYAALRSVPSPPCTAPLIVTPAQCLNEHKR